MNSTFTKNRKVILRKNLRLFLGLSLGVTAGCSSLPTVTHKKYAFPENAYIGVPKDLKAHEKVGLVKARATFETMELDSDPEQRCRNYFNKAVKDLVKLAQDNKADAVVDVRSVTFLMDGKSETYPKAECVDEGDVGEVYVQGIAIRYVFKKSH